MNQILDINITASTEGIASNNFQIQSANVINK